jgi:hypothetical protein
MATTRSTGDAVERGAGVTVDWADEDAWAVPRTPSAAPAA